MKRTILYYPTIDIPADDWLRNALLYWDEVSSIVPESSSIELSPTIIYLQEEEQFRRINPNLLFENMNLDISQMFIHEFFDIILSESFKSLVNRNGLNYAKVKIHVAKMNYTIMNFWHKTD